MMMLFLAVLAVLMLYRCKLVSFHEGFLDRETSDSIKGIFILIVLLSHVRDYVSAGEGVLNSAYNGFFVWIGQLMVAMFLFYSGYGCFESYKKKQNYLRGFLKNRVFKTLLHFDLALLLYALLDLALNIRYPAKNYLLCWIGWESIGNSNWYIFTILVLYLMTWLAFLLERKTERKGLISIPAVSALCIVYIYLMHKAGKGSWWYDTCLCFPCGMTVSFGKEYLVKQIRGTKGWILCTAAAGALFFLFYSIGGLFFFPCACFFCLLVILLSAKIKIGNPPLRWVGQHLFEIYILQRIPMILLSACSVSEPLLFTASTIAATLLLAAGFHRLMTKMDGWIFARPG